MAYSSTVNIPSVLTITLNVVDPILATTWTATPSTASVDTAVTYANTSLKNVLGDENTAVATQQANFLSFLQLLFSEGDATAISGVYTTPTQMLTFMDYIAPEFDKYAQLTAESIYSYEQQFNSTGSILGLNNAQNMYVDFIG